MPLPNFSRVFTLIAVNGWYVFSCDIARRLSTAIRSTLLARKLKTASLSIGPRSHIRGLSFIRIGRNFQAGDGLWLEALHYYREQSFSPEIVIGENVSASKWVHIGATNSIRIGANTLLGSKVVIVDHNHGRYQSAHTSPEIPPSYRPLDNDRSVTIGANVWLGDGVVVMPGANIGDGCVIGANSIVIGHIPAYCIAVGNPARCVKRFDFLTQEWIKAA